MRKLDYYYRVDTQGFPVPGSLQRFAKKPTNGQWKQLEYNNICCTTDPNTIDVFLIGGQSNAKGRATDVIGGGPNVGNNPILQVNSSIITKANDPVGEGGYQAVIGSAWPQFGITWNEISGNRVAFVPAAVSTTAQTPQAGTVYGVDNWSVTGGLLQNSKNFLNASIIALQNAGYNPIFKGVLWIQGETDAEVINTAGITQAQYITSFRGTIASYRATYGETMRFYIIRVGSRLGGSDVGFAQIREAQDLVANTDAYTKVIYSGTVDFPSRNLMNDTYHYKQAGYNEVGRLGAISAYNW